MSQLKKKNFQVKKLEMHLRRYKTYQVGITTLKRQLDYILPNTTASYELREGSTGTFNIKSDTENYAIDRIESKKALMLHEDMERYKIILHSIDDALNGLNDLERSFIELRYIKQKSIPETAGELGYNEKYIYTLRNQAFEKLLISLKGLIQF